MIYALTLFLSLLFFIERGEAAWVPSSATIPGCTVVNYTTTQDGGGTGSYVICYPPGYVSAGCPTRYPSMYWVHGGGGDQSSGSFLWPLLRQAMRRTSTKAPTVRTPTVRTPTVIAESRTSHTLINPFITIFIDDGGGGNGTMWVNFKDGTHNTESTLILDLIPHVDANNCTKNAAQHRAIEGFSAGGRGAGHYGYKYCLACPTPLFSAVSILSGAVHPYEWFRDVYVSGPAILSRSWSNDEALFNTTRPTNLASSNRALMQGMILRIIAGSLEVAPGQDQEAFTYNTLLHNELTSYGLQHSYQIAVGGSHLPSTDYSLPGKSTIAFWGKVFP